MWQNAAGIMTNNSAHKNLKLLWWLRNIAIVMQSAMIVFATFVLHMLFQVAPLICIIASLAAINSLTWFQIKSEKEISNNQFFAQILIDTASLFAILYFTGGAANPFTSLFILQVIIAAIALPAFYTAVIAGIAVALYSMLLIRNIEMPMMHNVGTGFFDLHIMGMWLSFLLMAAIVAWFVVRMNETVRRQSQLLFETEKMAAMGTLAASAAHELGTPLATLSVLTENISDAGTERKIAEQLARCKHILSRIATIAGITRAESGAPMMLDVFLSEIAARWQSDNPSANLTIEIASIDAPRIVAEHGIELAVRNLLSNAADESPDTITMTAHWTGHVLFLSVRDRGKGVATGLSDPVSTKPGGMGLGLVLVRNIIERLDGTFQLRNHQEGGAIADIELPLKRLMV